MYFLPVYDVPRFILLRELCSTDLASNFFVGFNNTLNTLNNTSLIRQFFLHINRLRHF